MNRLARRYGWLILGVLALLAITLGSVVPAWDDLHAWRWMVLGGAVITAVTLFAQDRSLKRQESRVQPIVVPFTARDWQPFGSPYGEVELVIPFIRHQRRYPTVEVHEKDGDRMVLVGVEVDRTADHAIRLVMASHNAGPAVGIEGEAIIR